MGPVHSEPVSGPVFPAFREICRESAPIAAALSMGTKPRKPLIAVESPQTRQSHSQNEQGIQTQGAGKGSALSRETQADPALWVQIQERYLRALAKRIPRLEHDSRVGSMSAMVSSTNGSLARDVDRA